MSDSDSVAVDRSKGQRSDNCLIPRETIEATTKRFAELQKEYGNPFNKSVAELLSQNSSKAVRRRLKGAGLSSEIARAGARSVSELKGGHRGRAVIPSNTAGSLYEADVNRLERILGINDLVDVRFLLTGARRTASVGRIRLPNGVATGFLVAPQVVMTNFHVFKRKRDAQGARIEFGFHELDFHGNLSTPTVFRFDTNTLFFHNKELDMAIVALGSRMSGDLAANTLPWCNLTDDSDLVIDGERLNVIQHPAGEPKQVALRDNTAITIIDRTFLHYRADTKRGSSGSPVFNDEWDLVGLHHSGVPKTNRNGDWLDVDDNVVNSQTPDHRIQWIANEAIACPQIVRLLNGEQFFGRAADLVDSILNPPDANESDRISGADDRRIGGSIPSVSAARFKGCPTRSNSHIPSTDEAIGITIPLEITLRLAGDSGIIRHVGDRVDHGQTTMVQRLIERFGIDDDYSNRNGYQADFLVRTLPLPQLADHQLAIAAINREPIAGDEPHLLRYHNFTVVMNGQRRIPFFTAVNINGSKLIRLSRDDDGGKHPWIAEDRIGGHEQTNSNDHYKHNPLDRGHLVRRLDPGWGETDEDSARGIVDTFHYSNCAPQYDTFNRRNDRRGQANGLWLGLEDFVLNKADEHDLDVSVLTGPVFRNDDPDFLDNGLPIPAQFWKVIAWCDDNGELQAATFLLSQKKFLDNDDRIERLSEAEFDFRERNLYQTTIAHLEEVTDLDFGPLVDRVGSRESSVDSLNRIRTEHDIRLH